MTFLYLHSSSTWEFFSWLSNTYIDWAHLQTQANDVDLNKTKMLTVTRIVPVQMYQRQQSGLLEPCSPDFLMRLVFFRLYVTSGSMPVIPLRYLVAVYKGVTKYIGNLSIGFSWRWTGIKIVTVVSREMWCRNFLVERTVFWIIVYSTHMCRMLSRKIW